jgi:CHAT domain-containing protein/Tfp pilus assembly protein PilF
MHVRLITALLLVISFCTLLALAGPAEDAQKLLSLEKQYTSARTAGHYQDAIAAAKQMVAIAERSMADKPPLLATVMNDLALAYVDAGQYALAEPLYQRSLSIREKALGAEHPLVAASLNNLAILDGNEGQYSQAEPLLKRAIAIMEKASGPDNVQLAGALNNLANLYDDQGQYARAEPLDRRALAIKEKALGPDHPDVAASLNNLANVYFYQGQFAQAEPLYRRALAIREKSLPADHPDLAQSLSNLAVLCRRQGQYAECESLLKRSLAIREKSLGPNHPDTAASLDNLANLYDEQGQYSQAEPLYQRSLAIREKALGAQSPAVAASLNDLAVLYRKQRQYAQALPLYQRALAIEEKILGPEHPLVACCLYGLAIVDESQGQNALAETLWNRAIAILEKSKADPALRFDCYYSRADLNWKTKHRDKAVTDLSQALAISESMRASVAGAEKERADFFGRFASAFERMIDWQNQLGHLDEALSAAERSRSRTLTDQLNVQGTDLLAGLPPDEAKKLHDREAAAMSLVADLEKQLKVLTQRADFTAEQKKVEEAKLTERLAAAREEQIAAYRDIRNASPAYRLMVGKDFKPVGLLQLHVWVESQNALLLQYFLGDDAGYLFIIPADGPAQLVKLEVSADQAKDLGIDQGPLTAKRAKSALTLGDQDLPQRMAAAGKDPALTGRLAALWKLLIPEAQRAALTSGKYERLILVPDGALVNLPFETLVIEPGEKPIYLLDRGPPIVAGPSATLLYNLSHREAAARKPAGRSVLTVGNPSYPAQHKPFVPALSEGKREPDVRSGSEMLASFKPGARYAVRGDLKPLPHSGTEVAWVTEAFSKYGSSVTSLVQAQATEANLRSAVTGREVIHLACHGLVDNEHGNFFGALALTPGKQADSNPADDGFLTLPEIYELKLKDCELAILSACQTNYGPQQRGEGVWALSRGFLVAGSRRVVASNWLVDDEAAASQVFYFCSLIAQQAKPSTDKAGPVDYAKALHDAKLWIRRQTKWQHPYYWATFTLIGPK